MCYLHASAPLMMGISFHLTLTFLHLCLFVIICMQGFIQKEKVHINCQKVAQVSILADKVATQWRPNTIIKESKQTMHYSQVR